MGVARRAATLGVVGLVAVLGVQLLVRGTGAGTVPASVVEAGRAAGCGPIRSPAADAPGGLHLSPGETFDYQQGPATSGYHVPAPLPDTPKVLTRPVSDRPGAGTIPEARAVHNLEHAFVILYYRAADGEALPTDTVRALSALVRAEDRVLLAPHADLPPGTSLAMAAWNKLWTCPATIAAQDAVTIARAFIEAYRGTSNAPEPPVGL
jgi:hypothetical protein